MAKMSAFIIFKRGEKNLNYQVVASEPGVSDIVKRNLQFKSTHHLPCVYVAHIQCSVHCNIHHVLLLHVGSRVLSLAVSPHAYHGSDEHLAATAC